MADRLQQLPQPFLVRGDLLRKAGRIVAPASRLRKRAARADNDRTMRALPAPLVLWFLLLCGFVVLSVFAAVYDRFPADLWLVRRFQEIPVNVHPNDQGRLKKHSPETLKRCQPIRDESRLSVGTLEVRALHTPGHSAGETCFVLESKGAPTRTYLFSGDTLFIRDCGRTDLESGSNEQMFESLQKLKTLPPSTVLLPGHHYAKECASTLANELESSPPLQCRSVEELKGLP